MTAYTVLYPVNELKVGGAEQQLLELVRGLDKGRFRPVVAPLYGDGPLEAEFRRVPGVEVIPVNRRGRFDFSPLWTLGRILRAYRVAIVQPFLSPATFFRPDTGVYSGNAGKGRDRAVWGPAPPPPGVSPLPDRGRFLHQL
jgi:hypothetical protein